MTFYTKKKFGQEDLQRRKPMRRQTESQGRETPGTGAYLQLSGGINPNKLVEDFQTTEL
jgi:hypothetical protein